MGVEYVMKYPKQAGAELCQTQIKLEVIVEAVLEVEVEIRIYIEVEVSLLVLIGGWRKTEINAILN